MNKCIVEGTVLILVSLMILIYVVPKLILPIAIAVKVGGGIFLALVALAALFTGLFILLEGLGVD